ncbi:MAG: N-acetylneuraminate synthase [Salibacteraceae bacterium]
MMHFERSFTLGKFPLSDDSPTFLIAEAGVNHGGDLEVARQLVDIAADAGANAVKFQAFRTKNLILSNVEKAPYQTQTTESSESQAEMLKRLELSQQHYRELKAYCENKNILFLITPFDEGSIEELESVGVEAYKVASTDTTNLPFLKKLAETGKPIILSTGMTYMEEVERALAEIHPINQKVILLQCTANYPIADEEANLNVIRTFQEKFDLLVGYSDHSVGVGAAPYAVPMGAKVVEKHFTLDKSLEGPDHLASLDPVELKQFVTEVRRIEKYLGSTVKQPTASEQKTRQSLQKCLVAKAPIAKGEAFSTENLVAKRTGGRGISPMRYYDVLGQTASRDFGVDDIIELES